MPKFFSGMNIAQMNFNSRNLYCLNSIPNGYTGMGVSCRIDDDVLDEHYDQQRAFKRFGITKGPIIKELAQKDE